MKRELLNNIVRSLLLVGLALGLCLLAAFATVVIEVQLRVVKYELICKNVPSSPECKQYRRWVKR